MISRRQMEQEGSNHEDFHYEVQVKLADLQADTNLLFSANLNPYVFSTPLPQKPYLLSSM